MKERLTSPIRVVRKKNEEPEKIRDIAIDAIYAQLRTLHDETKEELFDRLVTELLFENELGRIILREAIDWVAEENQKCPDDPMPDYSAFMIAFKSIVLRLQEYIIQEHAVMRPDPLKDL